MDYFEEKLHPSRAPSICKFPSLDECYQDKFDCNIILTPNSCLDEKQRAKIEVECDWQKHLARIERLAQPKKLSYDCSYIKVPAVPLQQLLPRIFCLSKPKLVTPKFVKPIEIPFELAGEIKDWKAHRKWLEKKAKPKKDHSREAFEVKKLHVQSRCGMIKIKQLAAPKIDLHNKHHRPKTYRKVRRFGLGPSMRIIELSVPKLRVDIKTDYRPLENSLRISKSALAYQPSNRIRALAYPKHLKKANRHGIKMLKKYKKCACCFRSVSCDFLGPIVFDDAERFSNTR